MYLTLVCKVLCLPFPHGRTSTPAISCRKNAAPVTTARRVFQAGLVTITEVRDIPAPLQVRNDPRTTTSNPVHPPTPRTLRTERSAILPESVKLNQRPAQGFS